jgi:glycosyltransferase involved in cell wall biosynthesis
MKILVSAIACDPLGGSESFVGWRAVQTIAKDHDIWVITSSRILENFQAAQAQGLVPENVHFIFHGTHRTWHPNRLRARVQSWQEYLAWNRTLLATAREWHEKIGFDLSHHVTYSTWRVGSELWRLNCPLVWGPVGGVASMPWRMMGILSRIARVFELSREAVSLVGKLSPKVRRCVQNAAIPVAANHETALFLKRLGAKPDRIQVLSPAFFQPSQIERLQQVAGLKDPNGPLRIFAGGNLIGSKGVVLALRGLAQAREKGLQFHYHVCGGGPEEPFLKQEISRLALHEQVTLNPGLRGEEYAEELGRSHIVLIPSFRENAGITMMECMLAGCVPIVAHASAQGEIVNGECGFRIPTRSPDQMARDICRTVLELDKDRSRLRALGLRAQSRIASNYTENNYRECINRIYKLAVDEKLKSR